MEGRKIRDLGPEEAAALKGLVKALEVAGDGDLQAGLGVMTGILKLVRATGETDPAKGVEKIERAIKSASDLEKLGRFFKWLVLGFLAVVATGAQVVEYIGKIVTALRGTGRLP